MLQIKKSVSISNTAGAAVFAAPVICLVCTVLAHFSNYNNTQQLQISSPQSPHLELIEVSHKEMSSILVDQ
jgi:hypothetical protein